MRKIGFLVLSLLMSSFFLYAQENVAGSDNKTPYDLMSSYYTDRFKPFKKKNWYVGLAFALNDKQSTNAPGLLQTTLEGADLDYKLLFKGGYYFSDYGMAGLNFSYYEKKFTGTKFQDPDTIQSSSISRGYRFTPNIRASLPLTSNERLSFYVGLGLNFGYESAVKRDTKNIDEITKSYSTAYNLGFGVTPGLTFFAMENFALEIGLNIFSYNLSINDVQRNGVDESRIINQDLNLSINLLTLELGLAYYIGANNN